MSCAAEHEERKCELGNSRSVKAYERKVASRDGAECVDRIRHAYEDISLSFLISCLPLLAVALEITLVWNILRTKARG